jgi:glycosyltransferase involved in cell wall biosynthesis
VRILALTRYERLGSSSRVRFYQYFPYLEAHGVEIVSAPFFKNSYVQSLYQGQTANIVSIFLAYAKRLWILLSSTQYDLLWIEKEILPWLPAWFESILQTLRIPYVVDYDDAVFHRYDMHPSRLVRRLLGHKIDHVMRRAALVVVGNQYLAERANQAGAQRVEYLPSVVDVSRYTQRKDSAPSSFRIGWIGSPVTAPYLGQVTEALELLSREAKIQLILIGSGDAAPFAKIPTTVLPWDEKLEQSIGEMFDVGIMPLVDGPFERGKCGYKLVQYMAGGLPVVASPIGVNEQMIEPGFNGYLASSPEEWIQALRILVHDHTLASEMGKAGRQRAEQKYNLQRTAPKLLDLLLSTQTVKN